MEKRDGQSKTLNSIFLPRVIGSGSRMAGAILSLLFVLVLILLSLPVSTLSIKDGLKGRELGAVPVKSGGRMEVEYVHSMYGVRQSEVFSIGREPVFCLKKVLFGSLAAALYYDPDPPSGLTSQDSIWLIKGDEKRYPVLRYRVSPATGHTLKVTDRTIDLSGLAGGTDGLIRIELEKRSRLRSLFIALKRKGLDLLTR
jgi:hypothetical protein